MKNIKVIGLIVLSICLIVISAYTVFANEKISKPVNESKIQFESAQSVEDVAKFANKHNLKITEVVVQGKEITGGLLDPNGLNLNDVKKKWLNVVEQAMNSPDTVEKTKDKFRIDKVEWEKGNIKVLYICLLYTSPSPRD